MTLTPEQELTLNRAIAEHVFGRPITREHGMWMEERTDMGGDKGKYCIDIPNYTRDLNAIVDVVQRWCEKHKGYWSMSYQDRMSVVIGSNTTDDGGECFDQKEPAIALCIAFAKAAGLKGDWE